jgi:type II secretory ATPase GspE/PulE/Tfp pilus assembly ATPase PilB-like protein
VRAAHPAGDSVASAHPITSSTPRSAAESAATSGSAGGSGSRRCSRSARELRDAICKSVSEPELHRLALGSGLMTMFRDGLAKAVMGLTTMEEVSSAVLADD